MPELPEIETIKNELSPWLRGQNFTQVIIFDPKIIFNAPVKEFCHQLIMQKVEKIDRRGKYLIFNLTSKQVLIMHLRMTGALLLNPKRIDSYARAAFNFSNGIQVVFSDRRRLGILYLVQNANTVVGKLGPEPLGENFTPITLAKILKKHHIPVKAALIDQNLIAGIGNMYADEILFAARINPLRKADVLSSQEIQTLHHCIHETLWPAIADKGASVDTYTRPSGQFGTAQFNFKVAHRYGETCAICNTPLQRVSVRGRGSYFCPHCQPPA